MELIPVSNILGGTMFIWTEIWLTAGILVLLLMSMSPKLEQQRELVGAVALVFMISAAGILYYTNVIQRPLYFPKVSAGPMDMGNDNQMLFVDGLGTFFKFLLLFSGAAAIVITSRSKQILKNFHAEVHALIITLVIGGMLMVSSMDLLMIYLAIEFVSIISYIMPGMQKASPKASEASAKYMLYGGVTSGLMIFGMSYLYGITGTTNIFDIKAALLAGSDQQAALLGIILFIAGLGYKISIVPFHFWAPDVYQGAPTPVTAFFSVAPKAAGFGLLIRIVDSMLSTTNPLNSIGIPTMALVQNPLPSAISLPGINWEPVIYWSAIATMLVGNLAAMGQKSAKRMLAYSSIAHAGYMLMGVLAMTPKGYSSITFYLAIYTVMNLGAFFVVQMVEETKGTDDISAFRGLLKTTPWMAVAMCILLFSLTGLPPFSGFLGKYFVFSAVVDNYIRFKDTRFLVLAVVGVLTSVVSLFYYARIVVSMMQGVMTDTAEEAAAHGHDDHGHAPAKSAEPEPELTTVNASLFDYGVLYVLFVLPTLGLILKFDLLKHWTDSAVYIFGQ